MNHTLYLIGYPHSWSPERARMLRGWVHSGFNVHRSNRVQPHQREDLERLAQYIIRNPFAVEKMQVKERGGSIIYRSGQNPKIQRNFEVFTPCDFIAAITQHIPDKSFQLVRYYGWYSNSRAAGETGRPKGGNGAKRSGNMRGQRGKQALEATKAAGNAIQIIDVSEHKHALHRDEVSGAGPRRIPSAKWRELIKKVWEADPLMCPRCAHEMRIVSLIDDRAVIEQILRHLGLWEEGVRVHTGADPPPSTVIEPWLSLPAVADRRRRDDPFPDYDTEPVLFANG